MTTSTRPPLDLSPDGPHTPDRIRALADTAAECIRALNYATGGDALTYPGEAYSVLGSLGLLAGRLPQLCEQISRFLLDQDEAGRIAETPDGPWGGDTRAAVADAVEHLTEAAQWAGTMRTALGEAQATIRAVRYVGPDDDQDDDDTEGSEQ